MKRKDVLSKDEIIELIEHHNCFRNQYDCHEFEGCNDCLRRHLNEEVETVPRYSLIKKDSDLDLFHEDWELYCNNISKCDDCPYKSNNKDFEPYNISCFLNYLKEGVYSNEKI